MKAAQAELEAVLSPPTPEAAGGKKGAPPAEAEAPDADRVAECEAALAEKQKMLKETVERLDVRSTSAVSSLSFEPCTVTQRLPDPTSFPSLTHNAPDPPSSP